MLCAAGPAIVHGLLTHYRTLAANALAQDYGLSPLKAEGMLLTLEESSPGAQDSNGRSQAGAVGYTV